MANEDKQTGQPESAFTLFSKSWELVQKNLSVFAIVYAIPFLLNLSGALSQPDKETYVDKSTSSGALSFGGIPTYISGSLIGLGILIGLAILVVMIYIQAMTYILQLDSTNGRKPDVKQLFEAAKKYWLRLFGLGIVVGLTIAVGLIALIVPGLIFIRRYLLSPYVMVDKDLGILDAMRQSAALSKPYSGSVWGLIGVYILITLPSVFLPVIGSIITFALTFAYAVAPALRYKELKRLSA